MIALGKWFVTFDNNMLQAENQFNKARIIATPLSDKLFEIKTIEALIELKNKQDDFKEVSQLQNELIRIKDSFYSFERNKL